MAEKEAVAEQPVEEVKEVKKERRGKRPASKSKHKLVQIWQKYKGGKTSAPHCPRCGPGTFLAVHKNRQTCGKCEYSHIQAVAAKK